MSDKHAPMHLVDVRTVAIPVADQDRALRFYADTLGFETRIDAAFGAGDRWIEVAPPGATTSIALMRAGDERPAGVDTGVRLETTDAVADHAGLRARGVDVDADVMPYPVPMFVFRDPDGNSLVIVESPKQG